MIIAWDEATDTAVEPERAPNVGEWSYDGKTKKQYYPDPVITPPKNTYSGPQFYKALTVPERELLVDKAGLSAQGGAIFEQIKLLGLDFNDPDDVATGDQMVTVGILTAPRLAVLMG